jgi:hypothetical protein
MRKLLVVAGVVAFSLPAIAQDTPTRVTPDAFTWKENPAFPKTSRSQPWGFSKFSSSVLGESITPTQQMIRGSSNHSLFRIYEAASDGKLIV